MAERVDIMVVAQDNASQALRAITSSFGALGNTIQGITSGRALEFLTEQAIDFGKESVDAFMKGAQAAKQLSMVSGESIENSSRFIQVLDDYQLGLEDALTATRTLTKQGLEPNLATLAKLSDQYKAIQDPQQKNEFIMKNLGRAGLQWAKVLDQGSESLLAQADAIDKNLIFTERMYEQAEKLRLQQDQLNDTWEAAKVQIGSKLVPALSDGLDFMVRFNEAQEGHVKSWEKFIPIVGQAHMSYYAIKTALSDNTKTTEKATDVQEDFNVVHEKTKEQLKAEEDAIKAITKANEDYLDNIGNLTEQLADYETKHNDIQHELDDGKITLDEARQKWGDLAAGQELATHKMMLNMIQLRFMEDGEFSQGEAAFLLQQGVKWGVYSQTAIDEMAKIEKEIGSIINNFNSIPTSKTFTLYTQVVGALPGFNAQAAPGGYGYNRGRAGGGSVSAGNMYRVNETRTEYFQPSMSGTVIPLGNGNGSNGSGVVINYSPMISLGNQREVETVLLPMVEQAVRKMQADGRSPL